MNSVNGFYNFVIDSLVTNPYEIHLLMVLGCGTEIITTQYKFKLF
jgi:hypothetical protein